MISIRHIRFDRLTARGRQELFDEMTSVVAQSVTPGVGVDQSWAAQDWEARRESLITTSCAYEARSDGELVGFVTYRLERLASRPMLHLHVGCVVPDHQRSGVGYQMTARVFFRAMAARPWAGIYVGGHVINPVVLHGWFGRVRDPRNCYPHIGDVPAPRDSLVNAACELASRHDGGLGFDKTTGVVAGKHLPGRRAIRPSGDEAIDEHFARYVDPDRGDTVLMLLDGRRRAVLSQLLDLAIGACRVLRRGRGQDRKHR